MNKKFTQRFAVPIIALSSFMVSINGLMVRSFESANEWQIVFGRNLFFFPAMLGVLCMVYRRQIFLIFRQMGWIGILAGLFLGGANTTVILAISHTTVANALFTLSACPLITAVLARFILGENISRSTILAIIVAMIGISIMVADGLTSDSPLGILIAIVCAFFFSLFVICLRYGKERNMLPASALGAFVGMVVGLLGANFEYSLSSYDYTLCFFWGGVVVTAVHFLFVIASRYVTGAEIMLITLIEFTLGPIWVWWVFKEQPTITALVGGLLVLSAVAGRSILLMKQQPIKEE